ncbi:MAG TPA: hypothetical protein VMA53_08100 [Stellaceae bacterium]|nr:hypothetical protein [Stellaceae bacterium]
MPFQIFISRKSQDARIARAIKSVLLRGLRKEDQPKVFVSEGIAHGANWREVIRGALEDANWLLLLYTGEDQNWSWCCFEVGIYDGKHSSAIHLQLDTGQDLSSPLPNAPERRVICIHHGEQEPPSTISDRQAVIATHENVRKLLQRYYSLVDPNGLANDPEVLDRATDDICGIFGQAARRHEFCQHIKINVPDPAKITEAEMPADTTVSGEPGAFNNVMAFFPEFAERVPWPEFIRVAGAGVNKAWTRELVRALSHIRDGSIVQPIQALHVNPSTGLRFRPVLYRVERNKRQIECEVLFVQDVGGYLLSDLPPNEAVLLSTMRLAYRMRYEVLNRFLGKLDVPDPNTPFRVRFCNALTNILVEAASRTNQAEELIDAFAGPGKHERTARTILGYMIKRWPKCEQIIWSSVGYDPTLGVWTKDRSSALSEEEKHQLQCVLDEVDVMNGVFLKLGSERWVKDVVRRFRADIYSIDTYSTLTRSPADWADKPGEATSPALSEHRDRGSESAAPKETPPVSRPRTPN